MSFPFCQLKQQERGPHALASKLVTNALYQCVLRQTGCLPAPAARISRRQAPTSTKEESAFGRNDLHDFDG